MVNQRPLSVRLYSEDDFYAITPSDLLLGRMSGYRGTKPEGVHEVQLGPRMEKIEAFVTQWWQYWEQAAFSLFTPRAKWKLESRAVREGDIVLLKSEKKLGAGTYRLAKVTRVHPDEEGVIRTVTLAMPSRRRQRRPQLEEFGMAVQRLSVLLPQEEKWKGEVIDPDQ